MNEELNTEASQKPVCPTCGRDDHPIVGACGVCGFPAYRDCEGDLLHVDNADYFSREHDEHVAEVTQESPAAGIGGEVDALTLDTRPLRTAPTLRERGAGRALAALQAYAPLGHLGRSTEEILRDLFTDILHLADALNIRTDWEDTARDAYNYEQD